MAPVIPIKIDPAAIYTEGAAATALGLKLATLSKARSRGQLRFVRRGRRVLIHGRDLLAWLEHDNTSKGESHVA